jgi:hypothetical protein
VLERVWSSGAYTNNVLRTSSVQSQDWASIRSKASWAGCMAALNKQLYCVSWRGGGRSGVLSQGEARG